MTTFIFILGLLTGSFLNVCTYRIPRGESIDFPPSHCTNCGNPIKPYDLVPVFSYLFLKGRCRYCHETISVKYPLLELATGTLFAALYLKFGLSFELIKYCVFICLLLTIGVIDFETTDVYFSMTLTGIITAIVFMGISFFCGYGPDLASSLLGGLLGGGFIAVIILLTRGMGWGDAEICLVCGLYLGWELTLVMLLLSFAIGGIVGIFLIVTKLKSRKDMIPFGPFIAIGGVLTVFFGQAIIDWYLFMFFI